MSALLPSLALGSLALVALIVVALLWPARGGVE